MKVENIYLNGTKRFKNNELIHLEKNLFSVPYNKYENKIENIEVFLANNQYTEIEYVAEKIIKIMQNNNAKYSDFSVITKNMDVYSSLIKIIFKNYNIPFFMDEKRDLNQNLIIKYIISILEIYTKNWSYEAVFNYIKLGFLEIDIDDIFKLESYCTTWGIRGNKWYTEDWKYGIINKEDEENVKKLNEIRKLIVDPIINLKNNINKEKSVKNITKNLYNFILQMNIDKILNNKINKLKKMGFLDIAKEYESGWNILMNIFDELILVFNDEKISIENYLKLIKIGIENSKLGIIPATQDQVIVGDVDRSRTHKIKYVFLIGVNDGKFPSRNNNEGFLNDEDRDYLKKCGIELAKGTVEKLYEENYNIYKAFTIPEEKIYISYSSSEIEGNSLRQSIFISKLKKIFPKLQEKSDIFEKNNDILTSNITFEKLLRNIVDLSEGKNISSIWIDIYNYYLNNKFYSVKLKNSLQGLKYSNNPEKLSNNLVEKLYGDNLKTSVSKLETYKSCPFSFYLKYGLGLKEKKDFKIEFIDTGSFMHEIIDEFFSTLIEKNISPKEIENEELQKIVDIIIDEKLNLPKYYKFTCMPKFKIQTNKLKRVIKQSIEFIIEEMRVSSFEIIGNEVEFKKDGKYKPIKINLDNGKSVEITGKIDRIDLAKNEDRKILKNYRL